MTSESTTQTTKRIKNDLTGVEYDEITVVTISQSVSSSGALITDSKEEITLVPVAPPSSLSLADELALAAAATSSTMHTATTPPESADTIAPLPLHDMVVISPPEHAELPPNTTVSDDQHLLLTNIAEKYRVYYNKLWDNSLIYRWDFALLVGHVQSTCAVIITNAKSLDEAKVAAILLCIDKQLHPYSITQHHYTHLSIFGLEDVINTGRYTIIHKDDFKAHTLPVRNVIIYFNAATNSWSQL